MSSRLVRPLSRVASLVFPVLGLAVLHCGAATPRTPGPAVAVVPSARIVASTLWQPTGDVSRACRVPKIAAPLVVDWQPEQRADLDTAMRAGVAIVAYDCQGVRWLKGCSLEGSYGYVTTTAQEQLIRLESADEVLANLPTAGAALLGSRKSELNDERTLDVSMTLVGTRRTTVRQAGRDRLVGGAACEGATHFVKGARLGAFTLGTGTKGQFAAGATPTSSAHDGDLGVCDRMASTSPTAPPGCNIPLRLELMAIEAPLSVDEQTAEHPSCPGGWALSRGKCVRATGEQPHQCAQGDMEDCTAQCDRGYPGSCFNLGLMFEAMKSMREAAVHDKQACDRGLVSGCHALGTLFRSGTGVNRDLSRAVGLFRQSCEGGHALGCRMLAISFANGEGVSPDASRVAALYERACDAGDAQGCLQVGYLSENASAGKRNDGRAAGLYQRACEGGELTGCYNAAVMLAEGKGVARDERRAADLFRLACDAGNIEACKNLAVLYSTGRGVEKDMKLAATLLTKVCDKGDFLACYNLGVSYAEGDGVTKDDLTAGALYRRACGGNLPQGCMAEAYMYEVGKGVARSLDTAVRLYQRSCAAGYGVACDALKRLGKPLPTPPRPRPSPRFDDYLRRLARIHPRGSRGNGSQSRLQG